MRRAALVAVVALASCARAPAPPEPSVFRDRTAPIWSNATFDTADLAGTWKQVGGFGADCVPGSLTFSPGAVKGQLCLDGAEREFAGTYAVTGPARLQPAGAAEPWWILWIDYDRRSMAIGTPSGNFGFVLDRTGGIPPDRLKAAREIFDWNSYDLARFRSW